jgi:hypothetical protein
MEILDASVGLKWVLNETDSDKARQLHLKNRRPVLRTSHRSRMCCLDSLLVVGDDDLFTRSQLANLLLQLGLGLFDGDGCGHVSDSYVRAISDGS